MGMSYFIFAFMESRKANPGSYANVRHDQPSATCSLLFSRF